ncbi:hypothetical protein [Simkania sp.]|uniref:hypothetical protein n=1 Tax=Simkania sp. TaxID=34094 RepID=UPI003B52C3CD
MATISREPTLLSSDIAVDSKPLRLQNRDDRAYQRYHRGISPDVAKLVKTSHFQNKVREVIPRRDFAFSTEVEIRVKENGSVFIREKEEDPWIKIYKKSEVESAELDEPIDEIVRKTREAYEGLFPDTPEEEPRSLTHERISGSSPSCHHCCSHHHAPESMLSRDELIRDLRDEVRELRREIERLKDTESRPPVAKVAELEHGLRLATGRIETLPDMEPTLIAQNKELRRQKVEINGLREDLTQANKDKAALLLLLAAASESNKSLQSQLQSTTEDLGLTEETLEAVMQEFEKLEGEKGVVENTFKERTEQLGKMFALFLGTAALYQQSQSKITELREESSRLGEDNEALQQNLEKRTKELQVATVLLVLASGAHQHNQRELQTLRDLHGKVSEEKEDLARQLGLAKQEVQRLSEVELPKEIEAQRLLRIELEEAKQQVEELTPKLETATKRVAELEELLHSKGEDLIAAQEATKKAQRELREAQDFHQQERERLRKEFTTEKDLLSEEHEDAMRKLKSTHTEDLERQLREQRESFEETSRRLESQYKESERKLTEAHGLKVQELEEQVENLGSQLLRETQRAEKAERLLEEKGSELGEARIEFEKQLRSKDEEVRVAKKATESVQRELDEANESHRQETERLRKESTSAKELLSAEHEEAMRKLKSTHAEDLERQLREQRESFEEASRRLDSQYKESERKLTETHGLKVQELQEQIEGLGSQLLRETQRAEKAERLLEEKGSELGEARIEFEKQLRSKDEEVRVAKKATESVQRELDEANESHRQETERLRKESASAKERLTSEHEEAMRKLKSMHTADLERQLREQRESFDEESRRLESQYKESERKLTEQYDQHVHELETQLQRQKEFFDEAFAKLERSYKESEAKLREEFGLALHAVGIEKTSAEARAEELQQRASELEEILRDAHSKVSNLPRSLTEDLDESPFPGKHIAGKIEHLLSENQRLNMEMEELQDQLQEVRESHGIERKQLEESQRKELEQLAHKAEEAISELKSDIEGYTSEIERLGKRVSGLISAQIRDKQKLEDLEEINRELREELLKTEEREESKQKAVLGLRSTVSDLERDLEKTGDALGVANSEIVEQDQTIKRLRQEILQRGKTIEQLERDVSSLSEDREELFSQLFREKEKNRKVEEKLLSSEERAARLEKELQEKNEAYENLREKTEIALVNMQREAKRSASEYEQQILELTSALEEKTERVLELEEENRALQQTVEKQNEELLALRKEVKLLRAENHELWSILERLAAILKVTIDRGNLEKTGQSILEGIKTSAFAKGALGEVASHIGLAEDAEPSAIHHRIEELLQAEKKNEMMQKAEAALLLKQVEELEASPKKVASSGELTPRVGSSTEPSAVKVASQQVASELTKLVNGLGSKPICLSRLTRRQREVLEYTQRALSNPASLPGYKTAVSLVLSHAKTKAESKNQKGFNEHIYSKNSLFDFIDRLDDFIRSAPEIKQIDTCQLRLEELTSEARQVSAKGTAMSHQEIETVTRILREIERFESIRQAAVQSFFTSFVHMIDTRGHRGINRFTKQETSGSSFPHFAKELMIQFAALNQLDERYYVGKDRRNDLIPECQNVEELRVLTEVLQQSLGALFAKIVL